MQLSKLSSVTYSSMGYILKKLINGGYARREGLKYYMLDAPSTKNVVVEQKAPAFVIHHSPETDRIEDLERQQSYIIAFCVAAIVAFAWIAHTLYM